MRYINVITPANQWKYVVCPGAHQMSSQTLLIGHLDIWVPPPGVIFQQTDGEWRDIDTTIDKIFQFFFKDWAP